MKKTKTAYQKNLQNVPPKKPQNTLPNKNLHVIMEYSKLEDTHKENRQCDKTVSSSKHFLGKKMHSWTNKMQAELPA